MNKGTLLIIGMMLGFEKGHEIYDGVDWDSTVADELLDAKKITKKDIFSMTPNGKSFFEYKRAWENFKKLLGFLDKQGETITIEDLKRVVVDNKTIIDLAAENNAIDEIFTPELWVGHAEEMERLWYSIDKHKRRDIDFEKIRREVYRMEGRETREDQLGKMGISSTEMQSALRLGNLYSIKKKLEQHGDHIRPADALLCDDDGDHPFYSMQSWHYFDDIAEEWEKHDEMPDADFFLFKRGSRRSLVESAFEHSAQHKIFNARMFKGRPDELMKLYDNLTDSQKKRVNIDKMLSDIVEKLSADMLIIDDSLTLENLSEALYVPDTSAKTSPVIVLGLKKTWDHMDEIRNILRRNEQKITLDLLRDESGFGGESCLFRAARFGRFDKVLDILEESGEMLELDDLIAKNSASKTTLDMLAANGQLDVLLKPELWVGRVSVLGAVWEHLPPHIRSSKREDFDRLHSQVNRLSLRGLEHGGSGGPPPAPPSFGL